MQVFRVLVSITDLYIFSDFIVTLELSLCFFLSRSCIYLIGDILHFVGVFLLVFRKKVFLSLNQTVTLTQFLEALERQEIESLTIYLFFFTTTFSQVVNSCFLEKPEFIQSFNLV